MEKRIFFTPEGDGIQDDAIEVEPMLVTHEEPIVWEYNDEELTVRRIVLHPQGARMWKAVNEVDEDGNPLMSFEPSFDAVPKGEE
jgi:hypothetical protein